MIFKSEKNYYDKDNAEKLENLPLIMLSKLISNLILLHMYTCARWSLQSRRNVEQEDVHVTSEDHIYLGILHKFNKLRATNIFLV